MKRMLILLLALAGLIATGGCGSNGDRGGATVKGSVKQANGQPLPGGRIDFRSESGTLASGVIKADGTYEAPGVAAGVNKVAIVNTHLHGVQPGPAGTAPMPGSDQKYVPINSAYANPESSGLSTTVSGPTHAYDVQLR